MERRSFLKGLLVSAGAGTAVVKLATPAETAALVVGQPALLNQPQSGFHFDPRDAFLGDGMVYIKTPGRKPEYTPIGYITNISTHARPVDCTSHYDGTVRLTPSGIRDVTLMFEGELK